MTDQAIPMPPPFDATRKLYAVAVDFTVSTLVYIVAKDEADAQQKAHDMDADALLSMNTTHLWTNEESRCELTDFVVDVVDIYSLQEVPSADRDVREHPDWAHLPPTK